MKIIKTSSGKKRIRLSRKEWENIGEKYGWIRVADHDSYNLCNLDDALFGYFQQFVQKMPSISPPSLKSYQDGKLCFNIGGVILQENDIQEIYKKNGVPKIQIPLDFSVDLYLYHPKDPRLPEFIEAVASLVVNTDTKTGERKFDIAIVCENPTNFNVNPKRLLSSIHHELQHLLEQFYNPEQIENKANPENLAEYLFGEIRTCSYDVAKQVANQVYIGLIAGVSKASNRDGNCNVAKNVMTNLTNDQYISKIMKSRVKDVLDRWFYAQVKKGKAPQRWEDLPHLLEQVLLQDDKLKNVYTKIFDQTFVNANVLFKEIAESKIKPQLQKIIDYYDQLLKGS